MAKDNQTEEIFDPDYGYTNVIEWLKHEMRNIMVQELAIAYRREGTDGEGTSS